MWAPGGVSPGWLLGIGPVGAIMILMGAQSDRRALIAPSSCWSAGGRSLPTPLLLGGEENKQLGSGQGAPSPMPASAPAGQTRGLSETAEGPLVLAPTPTPISCRRPPGSPADDLLLADQFQAPILTSNCHWPTVAGRERAGLAVGWLQARPG
jgi:hypothetical protein